MTERALAVGPILRLSNAGDKWKTWTLGGFFTCRKGPDIFRGKREGKLNPEGECDCARERRRKKMFSPVNSGFHAPAFGQARSSPRSKEEGE